MHLCKDIPDMNVTACQAFVTDYGSKIVQELVNLLEPNSTCQAIKLCPPSVFGVSSPVADDACTYPTQAACDANTTCTWCKCAAVPSQVGLILPEART